MTKVALEELNAADKDAFVAALGEVYEHAPWVAEEVFARRPFACLLALHEAMMAAVRGAPPPQRAALISGHPDLAGKAARAATMTRNSTFEQAGAGLDRLSDEEFDRFQQPNDS